MWRAALGLAVPAVFWTTLVGSGRLAPGYRHVHDLVSELGAVGAPSRWLFTIGMLMCAVLSIAFALVVVRCSRRLGLSPAVGCLLLVHGFSLGGATLFPLPMLMHRVMGQVALLLPLSPLLALILWRRPATTGVRKAAVLALLLLTLGFTAFFPSLLPELAGLKQRLAHAGWSLWFIGLGVFVTSVARLEDA